MDWGILLTVLSGLAIFIYGMHLMSSSLKSLSLSRIKHFFQKATSNRFKSYLLGIGVTSLIQSSSATSVIVIGFLNVGLLTLTGAVPIIFGANVGTTITAQLIAFKLTKIAPLFIVIGMLIFFISKKLKTKNIGLMIFGFGLLFFGLDLMSGAVKPLAQDQQVLNLFIQFGKYPLLGILIGTIVTVMFQSSSTTIGMLIALTMAGLINFPTAFFILLGDNIGTCVTALIASVGGSFSAKRLAFAHLMFNIFGTLIALVMAPIYLTYMPMLTTDIVRQIANSHTIFNIFNSLVFLPLTPLFVKVMKKLVQGRDYSMKETKYLDKNLLNSPSIAIDSVKKELIVMTKVCHGMMLKSESCLNEFNYKAYEEIKVDESSIDDMQKNITEYLVEIGKNPLPIELSRDVPNLIHSVNDLEKVGDHSEKLSDLARRKHEDKHEFSKSAMKELDQMFEKATKMFGLTVDALGGDVVAANESFKLEKEIDELRNSFRENHVVRMSKGESIATTGLIYTDILIHIEKIGDHLENVTEASVGAGKR